MSSTIWRKVIEQKQELRRLKSTQIVPGSAIPSHAMTASVDVTVKDVGVVFEDGSLRPTYPYATAIVVAKPVDVVANKDYSGISSTIVNLITYRMVAEGYYRQTNHIASVPDGGEQDLTIIDSVADDGTITFKAVLLPTNVAVGDGTWRLTVSSLGPFPYRIASYSVQRKEAKLNNS